MEYGIQKIISIYPEITNHIKKDLINVRVILNPEESNTSGKEFEDIVKSKVYLYEGRSSTHGYIIKIHDIVKINPGIIIAKGSVKYNVCISCNILKLAIGNILVGCVLKKIVDIGFIFEYGDGITILVQDINRENKDQYKIGYKYNIEIKEFTYGINKPMYQIIYQYKTKMDYTKKESIYVKKIDIDIETLTKWIKQKIGDPKKIIKATDYFNKEHIIKYESLLDVIIRYHIYIVGNISYIYDIPIGIRYISYKSTEKQLSSYNPIFTDPETYSKRYKKDSTLKAHVDNALYEMKKYKDIWDSHIKYLINPFEMLRPSGTFFGDKSFIKKQIYTQSKALSFIPKDDFPISRAYFKVPEIINMFINTIPNTIFAVADAPGGWSQVFHHMFPKASIVTTSLKAVKAIEYHKSISKLKAVKIDFLKKKNGDLLDIENINYLRKNYTNHFDIVASDGAIGYSPDIPKEIQHIKLFLAECIVTLLTQKINGHAFIKLYKRYTKCTQQIIYWMSTFYHDLHIYKPKSVRVSNSETFIILRLFKGLPLPESIISMFNLVLNEKINYLDNFISTELPSNFIDLMNKYNKVISEIEDQTHILGYEIINRYRIPIHNKHIYIDKQISHIIQNF
jgi:23S rRNA U2552 (ribose-2'-O)-methylase RlmE/FtsJ